MISDCRTCATYVAKYPDDRASKHDHLIYVKKLSYKCFNISKFHLRYVLAWILCCQDDKKGYWRFFSNWDISIHVIISYFAPLLLSDHGIIVLWYNVYTLSNDIVPTSCITNIWVASTKPTPMCPSSLSPREPNYTFLAPVLSELAYVPMLFMFQLTTLLAVGRSRRINNIVK